MSFSKLALFTTILTLAKTFAFAAATSCPSSVDGHTLIDAQVFDGPPSEMADMIGPGGKWTLGYSPNTQRQYYLVCHYEGLEKLYEVPVPTSATLCRIQVSPRTHMLMNVVCE
jgi:hypothetical protein